MERTSPSSGDEKPKRGTPLALSVEEATVEDFIVALSDRDSERLEACLHPQVHLRALVPPGLQEQRGASNVAERLKSWFEAADGIQVLEKDVYRVADRLHLRYRFRERYSDGESEIIEQDAYCDFRDGAIVAIDLLCSGHRSEKPVEACVAHRFDAGDLGCSSGLPEEFRRQIDGIPIGSTLDVVTRDPSAREDLPSLSRLLGHRVISVVGSPEGGTRLVIQRGV